MQTVTSSEFCRIVKKVSKERKGKLSLGKIGENHGTCGETGKQHGRIPRYRGKQVLSDGTLYDYIKRGMKKEDAEKYLQSKEGSKQMEYIMYAQEKYSKDFSYKGLSMDEIIHHLAVFISRLWQIHIFGEGNTRTTAVFFIKYLRTLGFYATNDIFAENAWYFRNALVRANYTNLQKGIHETTEYLEAFLRNLLLNEKNELHNRNLHISGLLNEEKVDIGDAKVDIENEKVDIQDNKVDIESVFSEKRQRFLGKNDGSYS